MKISLNFIVAYDLHNHNHTTIILPLLFKQFILSVPRYMGSSFNDIDY